MYEGRRGAGDFKSFKYSDLATEQSTDTDFFAHLHSAT